MCISTINNENSTKYNENNTKNVELGTKLINLVPNVHQYQKMKLVPNLLKLIPKILIIENIENLHYILNLFNTFYI